MSAEALKRTRAKLVLSDLHLGEGRRNWDGSLNVAEDFFEDDRFCEFLSFYSQAYDDVELVLAGNFLEMTSCRVNAGAPDILYETYAVELCRAICEGHPRVVDGLRSFLEKPSNELIILMGDADLGLLWPKVQEELRQRISPRLRFVLRDYERDGIYVMHGHQFDPLSTMDLNEAFKSHDEVEVLKLPWSSFFHAHFVQPLRNRRAYFYRIRPMGSYLKWAFFFETRFFFSIVRQFLQMIWVASSQRLYPGSRWRDIFKIFTPSADSEALEDYAEILLEDEARHKVIFGHSHLADYRQFRNGKEYFNSGTWTRNLSLDVRSLGASTRLTYVLVEWAPGQKDPRAKLMLWRGKHQAVTDYI